MSSRHSKSRSSRRTSSSSSHPPPWSDWKWSDEHQQYYRARTSANGKDEYEYGQPAMSANTPRTQQSLEPRTHQPRTQHDLGPSPPAPVSYHQEQHYTTSPIYTPGVDDLSQSVASAALDDDIYDAEPDSNQASVRDRAPNSTYSSSAYPVANYASSTTYPGATYMAEPYQVGARDGGPNSTYSDPTHPSSVYGLYTSNPSYTGSASFSVAGSAPFGVSYAGESSFPAAASNPDVYHSSDGYEVDSSSIPTIAMPYGSAPLSPAQGYASSQVSPSTSYSITRDSYTDRESSDPHYKIHRASAFKLGKVFQIPWIGPEDPDTEDSEHFTASKNVRQGKHGDKKSRGYGDDATTKVRRFIVITPSEGHCICLPILTYNGHGVNKKGVNAQHHAVIHTNKKVVTFKGEMEKGLSTRSIRVEPQSPRHKLDDASRVNYAKTYTVDYDVKVLFIGRVAQGSERHLSADYERIQRSFPRQTLAEENNSPINYNTSYTAARGSSTNPTYSASDQHYPPPTHDSTSHSSRFDVGDLPGVGLESGGKNRAAGFGQPSTLYSSDYLVSGAGSNPATSFHSAYLEKIPDDSTVNQTEILFTKDKSQELNSGSMVDSRKGELKAITVDEKLRKGGNLIKDEEPRKLNSQSIGGSRNDDKDGKAAQDEFDTSGRPESRAQSKDMNMTVELHTIPEEIGLGGDLSTEGVADASPLTLSGQIGACVFQAWPASSTKSSRQALSYHIEWDPLTFLENHVNDPTKLAELVTITGGSVNAEALSSREYLSRTYGDIGTLLLEGIELLLLHKTHLCVQNQAAQLEFNFLQKVPGKEPRVTLTATADYATQVQIATAASWMCASFQTSPHAEIMMSSIVVKTTEPTPMQERSIRIYPDSLAKPSSDSCWHSLFPNRVIANGFPIRARAQGVGLELSFQNMAGASRCLSLVEYENGLIAHGLTLILFPMKALDEDRGIQWHLEDKRKQKSFKLARISQVVSASPDLRDRFKTLKLEELTERRCFLGLAEHANVVIGTRAYQREFSASRSPSAPTIAPINSQSLTVESGFMGVFGGNGTYTRSKIPLQSTIQNRQELDIFDILDRGKENLALFFDTSSHTGWLIPQVSLALQMTHSIISTSNYPIFEGDCEIPDDKSGAFFAHTDTDAATEAANAVKRCLRLKIKKHQYSETESLFTNFSDMFEKVWLTLSNIEQGLEAAEDGYRQAKHVAPKYIHGVEFLDAVDFKPSMKIRYVKVDQAWAHLTNEHPLVILSREIEPAIVPDTSSLCGSWQLVPSKQSYLVTMGCTISSILERRGEGLADRLDWNFRKELIQSHKQGGRLPVKHTQKLASRKKPRSNSPVRHQMLRYQEACFVFGPDTDIECKEPILVKYKTVSGSYAHNGISHSATLGSISVELENNKSIPRKGTLNDLFSEKNEDILPGKLLEHAKARTVSSGAVDTDDYGDLYGA